MCMQKDVPSPAGPENPINRDQSRHVDEALLPVNQRNVGMPELRAPRHEHLAAILFNRNQCIDKSFLACTSSTCFIFLRSLCQHVDEHLPPQLDLSQSQDVIYLYLNSASWPQNTSAESHVCRKASHTRVGTSM